MPEKLSITKQVSTSIPSKYGSFNLSLYTTNQDKKEHVVLTYGEVTNSENILVRIHSECFTGDILGSLRCDCGEQLQMCMSTIANEGRGIIIYLRQEGRGIGLIEKLKTYNLQDQGKDTIDANLALGHKEDERSYEVAAHILNELQIKSIRLLTNNPKKIEELHKLQLNVKARVPINFCISAHNAFYLLTKIKKMNHFSTEEDLQELFHQCNLNKKIAKPVVTLAYAQSLDGTVTRHNKERLTLSSPESLVMTHKLRSQNDAILVGIGTIIIDDPQLTVRHVEGKNPQVIILDSQLRVPVTARILKNSQPPIIFTTKKADQRKLKTLTQMNVQIFMVDATDDQKVNLSLVLEKLYSLGIKSLMVEGGSEVITSFINEEHIDKAIITIAPIFIGGISVLAKEINRNNFPQLKNIIQYKSGQDIIVMGDIVRKRS